MFKSLSRDKPDTRLQGVIGPLVTTFDSSGDALAIPAFVRNIKAHLDAGQCGVLVCGSTGEAALLEESERSALVDAARAAVPAESVLLVGIGAESTKQTVKRAADAGARGADGVLVVSPHYYTSAMNRAALLAHFSAVADGSPVPVLLYNIPKYTHFPLEPDLVAQLAEHPNVVGIKDSSGDMDLLAGYAKVQRGNPRFTLLTGNGPTFATALELGARGGILAVALFTGDMTPRIFSAWTGGDHARARELQAVLTHAAKEIVGGLGVPGVKAAMDLAGLEGGTVRSPLRSLDETQRRTVDAMLPRAAESTSQSRS